VGRRLRPGGWLVFDLHADAMLKFAKSHPIVEGAADGKRFTIRNDVDVSARSRVTRIDVTGATDDDTFTEQHRQYFLRATEVRARSPTPASGRPWSPMSTPISRPLGRRCATWICRHSAL
jgi:hypothetical protein